MLSTRIRKEGYVDVQLSGWPKAKHKFVHVLVAEAFVGPRPSPKYEVNHHDTIKHHNTPNNLEWMTKKENAQHAIVHNLRPLEVKSAFKKGNLYGSLRIPCGRSKYMGVHQHSQTGKWVAQISVRGTMYHLGTYEEEVDAAIAFNVASQLFRGEHARLNLV